MSDIVTAGILVIGDEILSGRTKDKNIGFIAEYLTNIGIDLKEVRVVADDEGDIVAPKLKSGVRMLSDTVRANAREGDIGGPLREIANAHPDTMIGSYPFQDEDKKPNTNLVVRSRDPEKLEAAMAAVKEMLAGLNLVR